MTLALAGVETLSNGLRIGSEGSILLFKDGKTASSARPEWIGKSFADYGMTVDVDNQNNAPFWIRGSQGDFFCMTALHDQYVIAGVLPKDEVHAVRNTTAVYIVLGNLALFTVIFALVSLLVELVVITGIHAVNASLAQITSGNLDEKVAVASNPEFVSLSDGINSMVASLRKAVIEAQRHMERELALAKAIQIGSLPNVLTTSPYRNEFDIFATMFTAKEVGGDFYDFFIIDQNHLGFVIADVSGKGIPAALFMMTAKAHLKNLMLSEKELGNAVTTVNTLLCQDNQTDMFVTCFAAVLDFTTGELFCVNAGHNAPLFSATSDEAYVPLSVKRHFVLGGMEGTRYSASRVFLAPGARLLLYTDGITEAMDASAKLYGEDRLMAFINSTSVHPLSPKKLLTALKNEVDDFMTGAEQTDDITMLALEFHKGGRP